MKVKDCQSCAYYERIVCSSLYKPANCHTVGVSRAYAYCRWHKRRCLEVKQCVGKQMKD